MTFVGACFVDGVTGNDSMQIQFDLGTIWRRAP
jgi:hypothetical protein